MHWRLFRISILTISWLALAGFRLAGHDQPADPLLYDVRGAFVTAKPEISPALVAGVDRLVDDAIRATFRRKALPRAVLTVRIVEADYLPLVVGARFRVMVSVEATAVGTGEKIAAGGFTISAFALDAVHADSRLADRIADRVAREFRLNGTRPSTLANALFP